MSSTTRAIAAAFNQMITGRKLHAPRKLNSATHKSYRQAWYG